MDFHIDNFYSSTLTVIYHIYTFLYNRFLDPYIREFVSPFGHSNHGYFIDPRPVGSTIHLWMAFVCGIPLIHLRLLSADFTELLTKVVSHHRQSEYQGERFRALPHHSTLWIISSPNG